MASVDSENLRISFFGSLEIIPCLFDFLIAGVSSLIYHFDMEDLTLLIYLKINCRWLLRLLPQVSCIGIPVDSVTLWPIEFSSTSSAPASAITNGIPANQLQALALPGAADFGTMVLLRSSEAAS